MRLFTGHPLRRAPSRAALWLHALRAESVNGVCKSGIGLGALCARRCIFVSYKMNATMKTDYEELRIDCAHQSAEELALAREQAQLLFRFNQTMPMTEEYDQLMHRLFPRMGEGSVVRTPLTVVRPHCVTIGRRVTVMNGALMMAAGGITIDDDVQIAANAQLVSNNHDLVDRMVITCRPVHICRRVWIGAGATILPGVTVGENSVVGAGSVVTHDVEPNTIVAGNPARLIRRLSDEEIAGAAALAGRTE